MKFYFALIGLILLQFGQAQIPIDKPGGSSSSEALEVKVLSAHDVAAQPIFELLELGLKLPRNIQRRVDNFLRNPRAVAGLNPFVEWDLRIKVEFYKVKKETANDAPLIVDAFYTQDYERTKNGTTDFTRWSWNKKVTPYPFRVRFAPTEVGEWLGVAKVIVAGELVDQKEIVRFQVVPGPNKGYVRIDENGRYFKLGDETFFPSGQNLWYPSTRDELTKEGKPYAVEYRNKPTTPRAFERFEHEMTSLADSGGNYFRLLITPWTGIEWERMGNYYHRLNYAWEMDNIVNKAKELDLRIHLDMHVHTPWESPSPYGHNKWDWASNSKDAADDIWCYKRELGLGNDEIGKFFTNETARKYYKQRLRYIVSRWGYSTNIGVLELISEANNPGKEKFVEYDTETWKPISVKKFSPYADEFDPIRNRAHDTKAWRKNIENWQVEMLDYIKNSLGHQQHITAVSYTGVPFNGGLGEGDNTYENPAIDLMTYNWYNAALSKHKSNRVLLNDLVAKNGKPLMHSELGQGGGFPNCSNAAEFEKDVWATAFSGTAGVGLPWFYPEVDSLRGVFGKVAQFFEGIDLSENGGWQIGVYEENRDENLYTVWMHSPDETQIIGLVVNMTCNYFTQGQVEGPDNATPCNAYPPADQNQTFTDQFKRTVKLKRNRFQNYTINYYNPKTLQLVSTETDFGPRLKLDIPQLPLTMPFVVFKGYVEGNAFE